MTRPDNPNPEARPTVGKMPVPRFVRLPNSSGGYDRFVAIEAYSPSREYARFFLIHNFKLGDLKVSESRNAASSLVARTLINTGVEMAIGPAVLPATSQIHGTVRTFQDGQWWGVYAKIDPADIRNFIESLKGLPPDDYFLIGEHRGAFRAAFALAKANLPEPPRQPRPNPKPDPEPSSS